ncbi:MAG: hypothetical protein NMNS01_21250 [Nitrosomonas sp.]|nr:MAG: hypothetical protein NMNS01_21250 [Nitrosomonas sp.]
MSYYVEAFKNDSTALSANDNTALDKIHHTAAKALISAAVTIVDGDGEYEAGDSFARIAVIDTHRAVRVRIDDANSDAHIIELETENGIQFRAIAKSYSNFQIDTFLSGDWEQIILDYASDITPTRHWTFGDGSEAGSRRN